MKNNRTVVKVDQIADSRQDGQRVLNVGSGVLESADWQAMSVGGRMHTVGECIAQGAVSTRLWLPSAKTSPNDTS